MRGQKLLHTLLKEASAFIDKRIHRTLLLAVEALSKFRHLSIVGIGRTISTKTQVKHSIKRIDRLFGNHHLQRHRINYYQTISNLILKNNEQPLVIIDWSGLTHCGKFFFMRASVPAGGRALSILDVAFPIKLYGSPQAHRTFIKQLKQVIPANCHPIIVTDAGFRCPWFKLVNKLGWNFLGRARYNTHMLKKKVIAGHLLKIFIKKPVIKLYTYLKDFLQKLILLNAIFI